MSDEIDFTPDDVLGFEFSNGAATGESSAVLTVMFRDGTERKFTGDEVAKMSRLRHVGSFNSITTVGSGGSS